MRQALPGAGWMGVDRSAAELGRAAVAGAGPLVRADATYLPVASGTVEVVVSSMALMIIEPLDLPVLRARTRVYSDGVTEALNAEGQEFGDERLLACVEANRGRTPTELLEELLMEVRQFARGTAQHDDVTALVLRYEVR